MRALRWIDLRGTPGEPAPSTALRKGVPTPARRSSSPARFGGQRAPPGGDLGEQREGRACWFLETVASVVARLEEWEVGGEKRTICSRRLERDGLHLVVPGHYFMNTNIFGGAVILMPRMRIPAQEPGLR